ncbi:hypothetical protein pb186bvf_009428 [Paramecium bursaria]
MILDQENQFSKIQVENDVVLLILLKLYKNFIIEFHQ